MNDILGSIFKDLDPEERREGRQAAVGGPGRAAGSGDGGDRGGGDRRPAGGGPDADDPGGLAVGPGLPGAGDHAVHQGCATFTAGLGPDHPDTLRSRNGLAISYHAAGQHDRAMRLLEEIWRCRRRSSGPTTPTPSGA